MKKTFKIMITILSIWFIFGFTLKYIYSDSNPKRYQDVVMAQVFIKEHPELRATWKQLSDGWIKIKPRRGEPFYLKDGVIFSKK